jgi:hypothetical protein
MPEPRLVASQGRTERRRGSRRFPQRRRFTGFEPNAPRRHENHNR